MALQYSITLRNAKLDQIETTVASPLIYFFSGSMPADCATANSGVMLAAITPSGGADYMAAAATGAKAKSGTWSNASVGTAGTIGYFRFIAASVVHIQGTCTNTGGGGDMTLDNTVINAGQSLTVTTFTLTAGNP